MTSTRSKTSVRLAQRKQLTSSANKIWGDGSEAMQELPAGYLVGGVFKIIRPIGEGGMGVVYLAQHQSLGQQYALKVLSPDAVNEQNWLRFQAEAKILARLKHPTLVQVYDLGLHEKSIPFYSMDYLVGSTLEELLVEKGSLSLAFAIEVFLAVLDGLSYAHGHKIIHRDIKPANIFVCSNGSSSESAKSKKLQVKILDFGISKLVDASAKTQQLTAVGEIFGSPFYMSPEQCRGDKVDGRSDIYSVGCSLFEALTGFVPFEGKTSLDITLLHEEAEPPLLSDVNQSIAANLPDSMDTVIAKCLAKQPQDRYQSADEMALDLERVRAGKTVAPPIALDVVSASMGRRGKQANHANHLPLLLALALTVVLLGCGGLYVLLDSRYKSLQSSGQSSALSSAQSSSVSSTSSLPSSETRAQEKFNLNDEKSLASLYIGAGPLDDEFSEEKKKAVETFLAAKPEFFSNVVSAPAGRGRLFSFPKTFSLGVLTFVDKRGQNITLPAQGEVMIFAGTALRLSAGEAVKAYPALFKCFRPDDLHTLYLDDVSPVSRQLLPNMHQLTALKHLAFNRASLLPEDIVALNGFPQLIGIDLRHCHISGELLAKQKFLEQLHSFRADGVKDISGVLEVLKKSKTVTVLSLVNNTLSSVDIANLVAMPQLLDFSLNNCSLTNDELEQLTVLQKLKRLNLDQCAKLDQGCLDSVAKFKDLEVLILPDDLLTDGNEKFLAQRLPHLKHFK
jgi:serine/threonine protein kinase